MKFTDIVRSEGDTILHRNPIMTASVITYLRDWFSQIPLFSCGVLMLCRLGMEAEVDTSNNLQESVFKASKYDKNRILHSSDPGLFTMWKDKKVHEQNKKWGVQLRALGFEVAKSNYHKGRKKGTAELTIDEARNLADSKRSNHWQQKGDKI